MGGGVGGNLRIYLLLNLYFRVPRSNPLFLRALSFNFYLNLILILFIMTSREDIYKFIGLHNQVKILIIFDESSSLDFVETELSVDFLTFHKVFSNFPTS